MSAAAINQLHHEAADLAWLVRMASDLADRADREGEMGDVTRVAVLLRAIVRSAGEHAKSVAALRDVQGGGSMSAVKMAPNEASFGLGTIRLVVRPEAATEPGDLLFEVGCLVDNALAVFDAMAEADAGNLPDMHFAGLYLLRQAHAALNVAQGLLAQRGEGA